MSKGGENIRGSDLKYCFDSAVQKRTWWLLLCRKPSESLEKLLISEKAKKELSEQRGFLSEAETEFESIEDSQGQNYANKRFGLRKKIKGYKKEIERLSKLAGNTRILIKRWRGKGWIDKRNKDRITFRFFSVLLDKEMKERAFFGGRINERNLLEVRAKKDYLICKENLEEFKQRLEKLLFDEENPRMLYPSLSFGIYLDPIARVKEVLEEAMALGLSMKMGLYSKERGDYDEFCYLLATKYSPIFFMIFPGHPFVNIFIAGLRQESASR
jgi:hypothetical protein